MHALHRKPIGALDLEDLRLLIGQNFHRPHLLPLAMAVLRADPMAAGDFYEGDLLSAVMTSRAAWAEIPATARELRSIVSALTGLPPFLPSGPTPSSTPSQTCDAAADR